MSWLSPVSWAKWTWTAVRGGEEDGVGEELENGEQRGERGGGGDYEEEEEEERSQGCRQVRRGPGDVAVSPNGGGSPVYVCAARKGGLRSCVSLCGAALTRLCGFLAEAPRRLARSHARISVAGSAEKEKTLRSRCGPKVQATSKAPKCASVCLYALVLSVAPLTHVRLPPFWWSDCRGAPFVCTSLCIR